MAWSKGTSWYYGPLADCHLRLARLRPRPKGMCVTSCMRFSTCMRKLGRPRFHHKGGTFRDNDWAEHDTSSKEAVEIAMGGPARHGASHLLLLTATPHSHWRARELRRLLPELLAWSFFRVFPLTLVSRLEPGRAGHVFPLPHVRQGFGRFLARHGGSRRSLLR
jgi:hypothetical protein